MAPPLILSTILEHLDDKTFGLTLTVGVDAPETAPANEVLDSALWACPWLWSVNVAALHLMVGEGGNYISFQPRVTSLGVHAEPAPAIPAERDILVKRLWARYKALRALPPLYSLYCWPGGGATDMGEIETKPDDQTPKVRWPFELQAAGTLGAPHAHWLNLSLFFSVDALPSKGDRLIALPEITLARWDAVKDSPTDVDATVHVQPGGAANELADGLGAEWTFSAQTVQPVPVAVPPAPPPVIVFPGMKARCVPVMLPVSSRKWWVHEKDAVTVRAWRGSLMRDAARMLHPAALLPRAAAARLEKKNDLTSEQFAALRLAVIDGAFALLPNYRLPVSEVRLTELIHSIEDEAVRIADPTEQAKVRAAAATLDALRVASAVQSANGLGSPDRAKLLLCALHTAGFTRENAERLLAPMDPGALDSRSRVDRLRELAGHLTDDGVLVELWALATGRDCDHPSAQEVASARVLREVLGQRSRLAEALSLDLLYSAWRAFTLAARNPGVTELTGAVHDLLRANASPIDKGLLDIVDVEIARTWKVLAPTNGDTFTIDALAPDPMTPHPLVLRLGVLTSDPASRTSGTAAQRKADDWEDPLRQQLGVGLLVREASDTSWHCPTLGVAADVSGRSADGKTNTARFTVTRLGKEVAVLPGVQAYRDELSTNTIAYEGRWIGAFGPEEQLNAHGLYTPTSGGAEPLCYFAAPVVAPPSAKEPWQTLPALKFSRKMEMAAFRISLSGGLPPAIRDPRDPGRLRVQSGASINVPDAATREYRRAVPVSAPRLTNATGAGGAPLALPAIPAETYLRAIEIPGPDRQPDPSLKMDLRKNTDSVLLLAAQSSSVPASHRLAIRPPAVGSWDTWFRWQFGRPGAPTPDQIAQILAAVKHREDVIHEAAANGQKTELKSLQLDDPAVTRLGVALLEYVPGAAEPWTFREATPPLVVRSIAPDSGGESDGAWVPGLPQSAATNARRIPVDIETRAWKYPGGNAKINDPSLKPTSAAGDAVVAKLVEGGLYQLIVYALIADPGPGNDVWAKDSLSRWIADNKLPKTAGNPFAGFVPVSSSRLTIEVATPRWRLAAPKEEDDLQFVEKELYDVLEPKVRWTPTGTRVIDLLADTRILDEPFLHHSDLVHQRWRWSGRPIVLDHLHAAVGAPRDERGWIANPAEAVVDWEAEEFGDLVDAGSIIPMDLALSSPEPSAARSAPQIRKWSYTLDLASDFGASYHRFALTAHHRYAPVFGIAPLIGRTTTPSGERWRWHSLLLKAQPQKPAAPIALRRLIPLMTNGTTAMTDLGPAGFLALASDEAFMDGGLAERWKVEVMPAAGYGGYFHHEAGVDPRFPRSFNVENTEWLKLDSISLKGPFGHTLEPQTIGARIGRFAAHSYIAQPAVGSNGDLPGLVRFRIGRHYDSDLCDPSTDAQLTTNAPLEWTETPWIPLQPDRRLLATKSSLDGAIIRVDQGRVHLSIIDGKQRTIGARVSTDDATAGVIANDNEVTSVYLVVTQRITDFGGAPSELYLGLFEPSGMQWKRMPRRSGEAPEELPKGNLRARVLYCSHMTGAGYSAPKTEDEVWQRVLGPNVSSVASGRADEVPNPSITDIRNRLAYDGMSDPIPETRTAEPPPATC